MRAGCYMGVNRSLEQKKATRRRYTYNVSQYHCQTEQCGLQLQKPTGCDPWTIKYYVTNVSTRLYMFPQICAQAQFLLVTSITSVIQNISFQCATCTNMRIMRWIYMQLQTIQHILCYLPKSELSTSEIIRTNTVITASKRIHMMTSQYKHHNHTTNCLHELFSNESVR